MDFNTLKLEQRSEHILLVTLHRPECRNAINFAMMQELAELWQGLSDVRNIRCVVLTGTAPAFCAGADLKARLGITLQEWKKQYRVLQQAMLAMIDCPVPILSAVNGAAFGGGLELVLASDFAYAAPEATFAQSEVKLGIMPGAMGTQNLPRAVGIHRAQELALTGRVFQAEEALTWGIVNRVVPLDNLLNEVLAVAEVISHNAPLAVRQVKKAIHASQQLDIHTGYAFEVEAYETLLMTKDREEGISAFNEKRPPIFHGE